jgi:alkanesulfonate monooxygenase SsuD/methylene tetrahydromethanopterin reductase-like flavin-dependent oxidoreductase (luciferase family)
LLARVVATTDILTDGRLDLGLGAGRRKRAFDAVRIPWSNFDTRGRRPEDTVFELQRFFASDLAALPGDDAPQPVQCGGFGSAAFRLGTAADAQVWFACGRAGDHAGAVESHLLVQAAVPTAPARGVRSRSNRMPPSASEQTPGAQQGPQRAGEFERCA